MPPSPTHSATALFGLVAAVVKLGTCHDACTLVSSCIDVQIMRDNRHACGRATVFLMPVVIAASRHDTESCLKCFNAQLAQTWPGG